VALAGECPGHPDALGTERIIAVDPAEHARIGAMQYRETLPLADKEVVLTFDDGPLPPYTARILQTLASECVKATFFMIGRQAPITTLAILVIEIVIEQRARGSISPWQVTDPNLASAAAVVR